MRAAGAADVVQIGASWAEADEYLRETVLPAARARGENAVYVPPFDAQEIWDGNATIVGEVLEYFGAEDADATRAAGAAAAAGRAAGAPDAIVCSVGGGGLFCGIMQGLSTHSLTPRVLALETRGADSLSASLRAGTLTTLPAITSLASTLGAKRVAAQAFEYAQQSNVTSVVLEDRDAVMGCLVLAEEERLLVEMACGVAVACCFEGRLRGLVPGLGLESRVVVVVCGGAGVGVGVLEKWRGEFGL